MQKFINHTIACFLLAIFSCYDLSADSVDIDSLPYPYNQLEEVLPLDEGEVWFSGVHKGVLKKLIEERDVKYIAELGSWLGRSTIYMARLLPEGGKVYAIDHWLGSPEVQNNSKYASLLPVLYEQFLSNVIHHGLCDRIIPMRMTTLAGAEEIDVLPDLIYIDATHEEESVYSELSAWFPLVEGHGIICGDDWGWGPKIDGYAGVARAVRRFCKEHGFTYWTHMNWFWVIEQ